LLAIAFLLVKITVIIMMTMMTVIMIAIINYIRTIIKYGVVTRRKYSAVNVSYVSVVF